MPILKFEMHPLHSFLLIVGVCELPLCVAAVCLCKAVPSYEQVLCPSRIFRHIPDRQKGRHTDTYTNANKNVTRKQKWSWQIGVAAMINWLTLAVLVLRLPTSHLSCSRLWIGGLRETSERKLQITTIQMTTLVQTNHNHFRMPWLKLTSVDRLDISLEYSWGIWCTTVSWKLSNTGICLASILVARTVNSRRRKTCVLLDGSDRQRLYCSMLTVGLMLEMSVDIRSFTAMWFIQCMLWLLRLMDWFRVWMKKSRLSIIMEYGDGQVSWLSSHMGAGEFLSVLHIYGKEN